MVDYGFLSLGRASIVCVGSELSGDDAFGLCLYEKLRGLGGPKLQVLFASTAPENFIGEILDFAPGVVVVFDAADYGGKPGEVRELSMSDLESTSFSTHRAPMKLFARFFQSKNIPVKFIGVQAKQTGLGEEMSPEVRRAVGEVFKAFKV